MAGKKKSKTYDNDWPIVAICYDFDKTLSPKDMQNFELIPKLNCEIGPFWREADRLAKQNGMDNILAYMRLIVEKAQAQKQRLSRADFKKLGKGIELYNGVDTWFERVNQIAQNARVNVEHYIISAGLKEIIEGTSIRKYFTEVYASEFCYDEYGAPCWPAQVVNYTSKTQYLFRINKDCLDLSDEDSVNDYVAEEERRIPLKNFIYIGDSDTDIPAMKIVKQGGGTSIGVYNSENCDMTRVASLLEQNRINYFLPADYSAGSRMEGVVTALLGEIRSWHDLNTLNMRQQKFVEDIKEMDGVVDYARAFVMREGLTLDDINYLEKTSREMLEGFEKEMLTRYSSVSGEVEIVTLKNRKWTEIEALIEGKKKTIKKK